MSLLEQADLLCHLKTLFLDCDAIEIFPDDIIKLEQLEFIDLPDCVCLKLLSNTLGDIKHLRHLRISSSANIINLDHVLSLLSPNAIVEMI